MCECENFLELMKFKFLFIFLTLIVKCMFADGQSCNMIDPENKLIAWSVDHSGNYAYNGILKDDSTLNLTFKLQGTDGKLEIVSTDGEAAKYISATAVEQQLNLATNEQFGQLDEDHKKISDPKDSIDLKVKFKCNTLEMELTTLITVEDTNNHDPAFEESAYVYTLPMPMVPKYDLTSLGKSIIAKDIDFSNQDMTFTITDTNSNFILETESSANSKNYRAKLMVPEYTRLSKDTNFTLTATDSGNPTRTSNTQIIIKIDDSSSLPDIPTFSKASYKFQYSIKDGKPVIEIQNGPITVTTNNPEDLVVDFEEDSAKTYFTTGFNPETKEVTITSTGTLIETTENILVFTLKIASKSKPDDKSDTVILIEIPKDHVISVPEFSEPYYTATYSSKTDPDSIELDGDQEIKVSPTTESVDVTLEGDKANNFAITQVGDKWQLEVASDLDSDDLKKGGDIILKLKATVTGEDAAKVDPGYATLVIKLPDVLPEVPPKFVQSHYIGTYKIIEDGIDVVDLNENITVISSTPVTVTFESTYAEYFNINPAETDPNTYLLSVKNNLNSEILTKETEILLTLKATTSDEQTGTSAVVISLPRDVTPKFSKPNYGAKYETSTDGQGKVTVDGTISVTSIDKDALTVTIQESDYEDYFGIDKDTKNPNNYNLILKANLSQEILNKHQDIVLTLQAVLRDTVKGLSTVVISLPKAVIPAFSKNHYSATYQVESNGNGAITLNDGPIEITSPSDQLTVTILESEYQTYFSIELDSGNAYKLSVKANLPEEVLKKDNIVLTLQATVENVSPGLSTVVITLPKAEVVTFSKAHYSAAYKVGEDEAGSVTVNDGPIEITSPTDQSITITISEDLYTDYFVIELDSGNTYKVTVKQAISDDILKNGEVVLTLRAQTTGSTVDPGVCTLVIALPKIAPPKFAKAFYNAKYEVGVDKQATVSITDGPIEIASVESLTITIEGNYKDYFGIELGDDPQITVKKNLEVDIIKKYQEIILTVQASSQETPDSTCSTVIALALPYVPNKETLKFNKPSYIFGYKIAKDTPPSIDQNGETIKFTNGITDAKIAVKGTYANFFTMNSNGDGNYSLAINTPLEQKIIKTKPDIILTLEASLEGDDDGFATILLNLPTKEVSTPDFNQRSFLAEYAIGEDSDSVTMIGPNITFKRRYDGLIPSVTIVSGTNSDHFDITYNEDKNIYELSVKSKLNDETLIKETDIVLTLQAKLDNTPAVGTATLIIKLPKQVAPPSFSLPFYKAEYVQGKDKDEVRLNDGETISLDSDNTLETTVTLDAGEYADNFIISSDASSYTITVNKKLDEDVLYAKNEIIVTLVAAFKDSTISTLTTKASVKIALPGVPAAVTFLKPLYTGNYDNDKTPPTVTVEGDPIKIDSDSVTSITVGSPYDENFELIYDGNTKSFSVNVNNPLDATVVDQETQIFVDLDVETPHAVDHGKATLLLKMPAKSLDILPEFSTISYVADYKVDGDNHTVIIPNERPIKIISDHESKTVVKVVDTYASYFEPKKSTDGSYQIQVKKHLDDETLKTEREIYVSLEASIPENAKIGKAVIIVRLPEQLLRPTPTFSETYYNAIYTTDNQGAPSIKLDKPIKITSEDYFKLIQVTFAPFTDNFNIARDDQDEQQWNIVASNPLDQSIIDENSEITIKLTATLDDSISDGTATLIIKLPDKEIVSFDKARYVANYTINQSGNDVITTSEITVTPSDAKVIVEEDYQAEFDVECKSGKCTLKVKEDLSPDILKKETRVTVTIQATKEHAVGTGTAAVIIALPLLNIKATPKFTKTYYTAEYIVDDKGAHVTINDPIKIDSEFEESVQVSLTSYGDYFNISRDTKQQWNIQVENPLDDEILLKNTEIAIELMGHLDDAAADAFATLLVKLPEKSVIQFNKPYYTANYTIGTPTDSVTSEAIAINVEGVTVTTDGEYKDYFTIQCDKDKNCELGVQQDIPEDILESKTEILLVLEASMTGITQKGKATVIIKLPEKDKDKTPEFSKDVYIANYIEEDDTGKVILDDQITIKNIDPGSQVTVNVIDEYSSNFETIVKDDHWELHVKHKLTDDELSEISILLHLEATAEGVLSKGKAAVVIKLPKQVQPSSIVFKDNVYMAQYYKNNNSISIDKEISIEGDPDGTAAVTLDEDNEYAQYFSLSYKKGIVTVTIDKTKTLPDDVLKEDVAISVDIIAKKAEDTITTTLVVLVKLPDEEVIQFDKPYYTANYTIGTSADSVTSQAIAINIEGATVTTNGDYKDYFKVQVKDKNCELEVQKNIPEDILESKTEILLVLEASVTGITQKGQATVIIKLPEKDKDESPEFSKDVYIASYINEDDTGKVILDDQITIKNIDPASQVTVNVIDDYSSNFEAVANDDHWELNVKQKLTDDELSEISILLHLEASAKDVPTKGKAAVVIKLPKQVQPSSIVFVDNVYMAQYYKNNNSISIAKEIAIEGDPEGTAVVTLDEDNDYAQYFSLTYEKEIVTVTINEKKTLPDEDEVAISVDIIATKGDDTITTTLVVKLPLVTDDDDDSSKDSDCDTSGLIAGIAVLAVLLVAAIVGSAVFYYIKFRKGSSYENMEEPIGHSERFKRNSNTGTKNKFEHPTRRPTGVIKYPIDIADPDGETATEEEFPEKRKSVQFDTVNIDELEIEPEKSDDDVMYDDVNEFSKKDSDDDDDDQNSSQS